ncbi:LysR family transcriptional regulator [Psychromonas aquimarina]|uniref:LysR family transcriptional regulator n=1 Tax=Psychromonas aquimarina TaxID=444919 RepID=UPI000410BA2B|nr:LysR family transcriptional regulator [Psychromonas aquimarina]
MGSDKNIDLNLLSVFMVVCRTGSITLAAEELNLNQSSVSNAVSRFKKVVGEPLFIRAGRGIEPTAAAQDLYKNLKEPMGRIDQLLSGAADFDAATSGREFKVIATDYIIQTLLPSVQQMLTDLSLSITFKESSSDAQEMLHLLELEKADLLIDVVPPFEGRWESEKIISDQGVCVVRKGHPRINGSISIDQYLNEKHVFLTLKRLNSTGLELMSLQALPERKMLTEQSSMMSMLATVKNSDAIGLTISRYAAQFAPLFNLQVLEVPFSSKPIDFYMIWNKKFNHNPAHKWLRKSIKETI